MQSIAQAEVRNQTWALKKQQTNKKNLNFCTAELLTCL